MPTHGPQAGSSRRAPGENVGDIMREPLLVPESLHLEDVLVQIRKSRTHFIIVLDEFGSTSGILTLEDILEELVGEIRDEHDAQEPVLLRGSADRWTADGRLPVGVLEERLGLELGEEAGFETLAGFLMDHAGEVPRVGSVHEHGGWRFEVLSGDEKHVGLVRITRAEPADGA